MNPGWFWVGLEIGQRIAPTVRKPIQRVVRQRYWAAEERISRLRGRAAYRRWLATLPTLTKERG